MRSEITPVFGMHDLGTDVRGGSFSMPAALLGELTRINDVHVMTVRPGYVRGNHYHKAKDELFIVLHSDSWTFHWSSPEAPKGSRSFTAKGGVTVRVPRLLGHAIVNDGAADLVVIGLSSMAFDANSPDSFPMEVF
jgi:mannose-6-phosphate isomerase-like protein (cupin superfamily)